MGKKEKEPKPEVKFYLRLNGEREICTPDNTMAFLYENPDHDHIYLIDEVDGEHYRGRYVWRDFIKEDEGAFDNLIKYMINNGYFVDNLDKLPEAELRAFHATHPDKINLPQHELTSRQEKLILFLGYVLDKEKLVAGDFDGKGELFI